MNIITIGIDLAKNVFAVHGFNETGKPELVKPKVVRDQLKKNIVSDRLCFYGTPNLSAFVKQSNINFM